MQTLQPYMLMSFDFPFGRLFGVRKFCYYPYLPIVIPQQGIDAQRQWYLYQEVAPYCQDKEVCPKPGIPKPIIKMDTKQMYC